MKKIPSVFCRNYDGDRLVRDEVVPGCEWVLAGEGRPTEKIDGTACLIRDGVLFGRYTVKRGKTPPPGFEPATEMDPVTGKQEGWVPVGDGPEWAAHREGHENEGWLGDGTYELIGPKVQGNPYRLPLHRLEHHGDITLPEPEGGRTFANIRAYLADEVIEGIVWWHEDGRMAKIKRRDFGLTWPVVGDE